MTECAAATLRSRRSARSAMLSRVPASLPVSASGADSLSGGGGRTSSRSGRVLRCSPDPRDCTRLSSRAKRSSNGGCVGGLGVFAEFVTTELLMRWSIATSATATTMPSVALMTFETPEWFPPTRRTVEISRKSTFSGGHPVAPRSATYAQFADHFVSALSHPRLDCRADFACVVDRHAEITASTVRTLLRNWPCSRRSISSGRLPTEHAISYIVARFEGPKGRVRTDAEADA